MRLNEIRSSDFLQGTREALGDALVHPILTRRALWDSRELPRITNGYIELHEWEKQNYLSPPYLLECPKSYSTGYKTGAYVGLAASLISLGLLNIVSRYIDYCIKTESKGFERK